MRIPAHGQRCRQGDELRQEFCNEITEHDMLHTNGNVWEKGIRLSLKDNQLHH